MENFDQDYADMADDDLERICRHRNELIDIFKSIRRTKKTDKDSLIDDVDAAEGLALEAFDEVYHAEWRRLRKISGSIAWSAFVGNQRPPFRPQTIKGIHPQTLMENGHDLSLTGDL